MKQKPPLASLLFLIFASIGLAPAVFCQNPQTPSVTVKTVQTPIKIDGIINETAWEGSRLEGDFWQYFPSDTARATGQTELYITCDANNIYVAAKCYTSANKFVVPSYRRDYRAGGNDNISFVFDTFNDKTNAFLFGMNPLGVMREALIYNGGSDADFFNTFWDNKWTGVSKTYENYWVCEAAIPFKTLRYKDGVAQWNFMCYRFDTQLNETSTWVRVPQNQLIFNLAFTAPLYFEQPLKKPGLNVSVIPYARTGFSQDNTAKNSRVLAQNGIGADVKVGITPGMVLDLSVNPDFSQVEADRQIQNLTRFDISYSFPEQRQFFLENSDLFGGFGNQNVTPFFSRRVGLAIDTTTGVFVPNPIRYGARLNGKLDNNWRLGVLNLQTADEPNKGIPGTNYTVGVLQRKLFSRSNVSVIFVNKHNLNPEINPRLARFNRAAGIEYNLASTDNRWQGKFYYHQTFSARSRDQNFASGGTMTYNKLRYQISLAGDWVGRGFDAEVGFVPRTGVWRVNPQAQINFYPRNRIFNRHSIGLTHEQFNIFGTGLTDRATGLIWTVLFTKTGRLTAQLLNNFTYLFSNFDPTLSGATPLLAKSTYTYNNLQFSYLSDQRRKLNVSAQGTVGQYFNGNIMSVSGALLYRFQPFGNLTLNYSFSQINTPTAQNTIYLVGPRTDITFSKNVFWTTFLQYNTRSNNFNVNSRVQWRFKPVSDFFLVYSDNYFADSFARKNRALVAKITYWFNV